MWNDLGYCLPAGSRMCPVSRGYKAAVSKLSQQSADVFSKHAYLYSYAHRFLPSLGPDGYSSYCLPWWIFWRLLWTAKLPRTLRKVNQRRNYMPSRRTSNPIYFNYLSIIVKLIPIKVSVSIFFIFIEQKQRQEHLSISNTFSDESG
ncbi:unnamed protein product [Auanema sp. JU1783]|nr:unnamed protein product [Auanema sp. JU1783]